MKLAIVASHPIQYYAPLFSYLAAETPLQIKVFYLWDFGVTEQMDRGFQRSLQWDIPLLKGYDYEFVENISANPGTHHRAGLQNPTLLERVKHYSPDAILLMVSYNYDSIYQFLWRSQTYRVPLLFRGDSHRLLVNRGVKSWAKRLFISTIFKRFAACLYVGKANHDYFRYHRVPEQKLFFAPHSVDNQRFFDVKDLAIAQAKVWRAELGIPSEHLLILFAGKFVSKKRPLDLVHAFLDAKFQHTSLLFVGAGELEPDLRLLAAHSTDIYFAPFQNQSLMPRTYAAADLVVLPSYGSSETWGLAINEAMCMARPVIVSNHVGCAQDLVHSDRNGLIFTAGDRVELATCLKEACSDRDRLQAWGKASHKIILNYSYAKVAQGMMSALHYVKESQS
ncbi:glycosyltransferase family 4 protein [Tumidithrix elongata RA019]|uniref:Glycosyltransferase family 4 protein n=1 Tax=Tumidithrix elongata BACA0141 TaxID=2716417 RepID=A0AAW9PU55_9CYAN|nr:glycosyltransferase family 4 protein [Tumidithrix elongata RA019]